MNDETKNESPTASSAPTEPPTAGSGVEADADIRAHEAPVCPRCGCVLLFPCDDADRVPRVGDTVVLRTLAGKRASIVTSIDDEAGRVNLAVLPSARCPMTSERDLVNGELRAEPVFVARGVKRGVEFGQFLFPWEADGDESEVER